MLRLILKKIKQIFVIHISILLSWSAMAQGVSSSNQGLQNVQNNLSESGQAFYNALYSKDCSIPEGTQILHYPMIHQTSIDNESVQRFKAEFNVEEAVAFSQWRLLQLIRQHPNALVFAESISTEEVANSTGDLSMRVLRNVYCQDESAHPYDICSSYDGDEGFLEYFWKEMKREWYGSYLRAYYPSTYKDLENVQDAQSYDEITSLNKKVLYYGASLLAVALGLVERLYPVTLMSSLSEIFPDYWKSVEKDPKLVLDRMTELPTEMMDTAMQYRQEESEDRRQQIKESFRVLFEEFVNLQNLVMGMVLEWREQLLFESVHQTLSERDHQDKMVIIAYGAGHDFSDDFKDYNFYALPYSCSLFNTNAISPLDVFVVSMFYMMNSDAEENTILSQFVLDHLDYFSDEDARPFHFLFKNSPKLRGVSEEEFSVARLREYLVYTMDSSLEPWEKTFNDYSTMNDEERSNAMKLAQEAIWIWKQLLSLGS